MNWYKQCMPSVKDVTPVIKQICADIKAIPGVDKLYLYGSYAEHLDQPNYVLKDIDIIAVTNFDSGDLLAIDNSKYSALRIHPNELEDEGFNPDAVIFTKRFLSFDKYNVDHWATTIDNKLVHWGAIPDSVEEWTELHAEAEKQAISSTGCKRANLKTASDDKKQTWKKVYDQYISKHISKASGWYPSDKSAKDVLEQAKEVL